jgi:hypothetical protein
VEGALKPREQRADTARQHPFSHRTKGVSMEQALSDSQNVSSVDDPHACDSCGRAPARRLVIRRHVGMLYLQKFSFSFFSRATR